MLNDEAGVNDVSKPSIHREATATDATHAVEPVAEMVVSDLAVLRVLSDELRLQLLEAFGRTRGAPRTVKEVAREIGQSPTKLYYHVNLLEEHGLLLVAESRLVSGILEKRYVPAAHRYSVDKQLLRTAESDTDPAGRTLVGRAIDSVLGSTAEDFKRAIAAGLAGIGEEDAPRRRSVLSKSNVRLRPEDAAKVIELLESLIHTKDEDDPDADLYALTVAFFRRGTTEENDQ